MSLRHILEYQSKAKIGIRILACKCRNNRAITQIYLKLVETVDWWKIMFCKKCQKTVKEKLPYLSLGQRMRIGLKIAVGIRGQKSSKLWDGAKWE